MEHPSTLMKFVGLSMFAGSCLASYFLTIPAREEPILAGRYHLRQHTSAAASAFMGRSGIHRSSTNYRDHRDHVSPIAHPPHQHRPQQMIATKPETAVRS